MARRRNRTAMAFPTTTDAASLDAAFPTSENSAVSATLEKAKEKKDLQDAVAKIPEIFSPEQVKWVFDVYVAALSFIYSVALKTDFKAISEELKFEDAEKDMMAKPLARILSKYAPSEWAGMQPEIELITCMGIWTVTSVTRAKKAAEKYQREQQMEMRTKQRQQHTQPMREQHGEPAVTV